MSSERPKPPKIDRVRRPALTDATAGDVVPGDTHEGERYAAADFSDVELDHTTFVACTLDRCRFDGSTLRGVHFVESELVALDVPVLSAPRSTWRSVGLTGSRLGSAELYESSWRSVVVSDTKINYLNARTATWTDVIFRNCVIEELDLAYASVTRLRIEGGEIGTLDVSDARLSEVDLRGVELTSLKGLAGLAGAWISEEQLTRLAPALAAHLRIRIG